MKTTMKHIAVVALAGLALAQSAQAVDLSKVPDVRKVSLSLFNKSEVAEGRRPDHCDLIYDKSKNDPACFDGVLSKKEAFGYYANSKYQLGKPLTEGNKARENKEGLQTVINEIKSVYAGTETAILNKKPELNRSLAGLFNTFNDAIEDVKPYVLSIANGHYDKETLIKLQEFNNVFTNGWRKSAPAMAQYKGISEEKAEASTRYYKGQFTTIRHIISQLNKYYQ